MMTILWFFLVVSWNGEVTAFHGFKDDADCSTKRAQYAKDMARLVRDVTDCIGVPIREGRRP